VWFYKALAGIRPDLQTPGFKHFFVRPNVVGDLTSARGEYNSIRGKIVSDWQVVKGEFRLNLTVPANTSATVSLPIAGEVMERGKALTSAGVKLIRNEPGRTSFEVGSGAYRFSGSLAR
jgi:alpha-L-rhamnosidase